jgi:hypothetical protein
MSHAGVSFLIKLAAFQAGSGAENKTMRMPP